MTEVCRIPLGRSGEHFALIDAEDYGFLTQWLWTYKRSAWAYGAKYYARRHQRIDGRRVTILMHTLILTKRMGIAKPSDAHTGDHFPDTDSLNNTRENLRWATKSQQSGNQRTRINPIERAVLDGIADTF
jgi:hypothetical protein